MKARRLAAGIFAILVLMLACLFSACDIKELETFPPLQPLPSLPEGTVGESLPPTTEVETAPETPEAGEPSTDGETADEETVPTEQVTSQETAPVGETAPETEPPTASLTGEQTEAETAPETEAPTESAPGDREEHLHTPEELLEALGEEHLPAFRADKMYAMAYYYCNYYVGALPTAKDTAKEMKRLYKEYFQEYVDNEDDELVTDVLLSCYQAAVGDKYAIYMNADSYSQYEQDSSGEHTEIGIYINYNMLTDTALILSVYKDTPAETAGLLAGDYITAVDDVPVKELGYYGLLKAIRGEHGTTVKITVDRGGQTLSFSVLRQKKEHISVTGKLLDTDATVGYIKISNFDAKTFSQFKQTVDGLIEAGATRLLFDLRNNPGGELPAIISVLDYILEDGLPITTFRYREGSGLPNTVITAEDGHKVDLPMTILCNAYTASAGELFTAALQDHGVATVVGEVTYGKGTAQTMVSYVDGSAFTISFALYDPPRSPNYEGKGVTPDVLVTLDEEASDPSVYDEAKDNQLQAAVAILNGQSASER